MRIHSDRSLRLGLFQYPFICQTGAPADVYEGADKTADDRGEDQRYSEIGQCPFRPQHVQADQHHRQYAEGIHQIADDRRGDDYNSTGALATFAGTAAGPVLRIELLAVRAITELHGPMMQDRG